MPDILIQPNADADDDLSNAIVMDDTTLPLSSQGAVALGLTLGTTYKARVLGVVETFSVAVPATAPAQMSAPTVTATGANSISVDLAAAPADGGSAITSYDLRHSTNESDWIVVTGVTDPQMVSGLTASTLYYVQTRAVNAVGAGTWSTSGTATTDAAPSALFTDDFTSYALGSNIHDSPRYSRAAGFLNLKVQDDGGTRIVGPVDQTQNAVITYVDQTVSADRKVSWTYHRARAPSNISVDFFAAYTDGNNYVHAQVDAAGWLSIRHVVGGTGSFSTVSIPPGGLSEGETISIELDNGTMTVQVEGVNVTTPKTVPVVALGPPGFGMTALASDTTDAAISYFDIEEI